jgi:hypothetical protein
LAGAPSGRSEIPVRVSPALVEQKSERLGANDAQLTMAVLATTARERPKIY